jgi:hypothetical protein
MRPHDKKKNIKKANLLAEQRYLASKGIINEAIQTNPQGFVKLIQEICNKYNLHNQGERGDQIEDYTKVVSIQQKGFGGKDGVLAYNQKFFIDVAIVADKRNVLEAIKNELINNLDNFVRSDDGWNQKPSYKLVTDDYNMPTGETERGDAVMGYFQPVIG